MYNKLFIVHGPQFGYHTDIYKWCEYLKESYEINLLCFDNGKPRYFLDNVHVHYVNYDQGRLLRWAKFLVMSFCLLFAFEGIIIICHFKLSKYVKKMLPWKKMILDIRTFSVHPDEKVREYENNKLFESVRIYDYVTVISEGLRKQLPKDLMKTAVLPLGSEIIELPKKRYDSIDLLYVGTFYNRHLEDTINGFALAKNKIKDIRLHYHIVGYGIYGEDEKLKKLCHDLKIEDVVIFHGRQPHDQLLNYYKMCNVGVSYVPLVPYYENQPVTKTFEYIMAGLYTIATATLCNKEVIYEENGVLIEDNAASFCHAIESIIERKDCIDSSKVRSSLNCYQWKQIVNTIMKEILVDYEQKCLK